MHYAYLVPCFSLNLISVPRGCGGVIGLLDAVLPRCAHMNCRLFAFLHLFNRHMEWLSLPCFSGARTWTQILKSLGTTLTWHLVQTSVMLKLFSKGNADDLRQRFLIFTTSDWSLLEGIGQEAVLLLHEFSLALEPAACS